MFGSKYFDDVDAPRLECVNEVNLAYHSGVVHQQGNAFPRQLRYQHVKLVSTKDDEPMEFVSFEDTTGLYETTFFPDAYRRFCRILSAARPYLLEGVVEEEHGAVTLTVRHAEFLDREPTRASALLARRASFADAARPARVQSVRR